MAKTRQIPAFSGEKSWYGLDPIHPRRAAAGEIWRRMLAALNGANEAPPWPRPSRDDARRLRRVQAQFWSRGASLSEDAAHVARLGDGSTVALF
jgi:hypothetical protein